MHTVFVYGSLMQGMPNHRLLGEAQFAGSDETSNRFTMIAVCRWFPGVSKQPRDTIKGEVYAVSDSTLAQLDRLEGHPHFYCRSEVALASGRHAWMYILNSDSDDDQSVVPNGDWAAFFERS